MRKVAQWQSAVKICLVKDSFSNYFLVQDPDAVGSNPTFPPYRHIQQILKQLPVKKIIVFLSV